MPKKDYYPKNKLNVDVSIVDRLKYHDFDSSFSQCAMYFAKMGFGGRYTGSAEQNTLIPKSYPHIIHTRLRVIYTKTEVINILTNKKAGVINKKLIEKYVVRCYDFYVRMLLYKAMLMAWFHEGGK